MTATVTKGLLLREDLNHYDGVSTTASRKDTTGGIVTGQRIGDIVDVLQVYGNGKDRTGGVIQDAINAIGTSTNVGLLLSPGAWVVTANLTIASNFTLIVPAGATIEPASGITVTINGGLHRFHATYTGGSGTVTVNGFDSLATTTTTSEYAADTGTADTYVIAPSPAIGAYTAGQRFRFLAANANTGASTVNVSDLGAKAIKKNVTTDLTAGNIAASQIVDVVYDGTNFQIMGNPISASLGANTFTGAQTVNAALTTTGAFTSLGIDDNADAIAITINSSEQVLIGGTTALGSEKLLIQTGASGATPATDADELVIDSSTNAGITILSGTSSTGTLSFGDSGDLTTAFIQYDHNGNLFVIASHEASAETELRSGNGVRTIRLDANQNVVIGTAALATNATDGFLYIPSSAGAPTGTPTSFTGRVPLHYDSTNNKLYVYDGSWLATAALT